MRKADADARYCIENSGLHLGDQVFARAGRRPFVLRLENHKHVGQLHSHHVGRHLGTPGPGHDLHHFRKSADHPFNIQGIPDRLAQRHAGQAPHLNHHVSFVEARHKLDAEPRTDPEAHDKQPHGRRHHPRRARYRPSETGLVGTAQHFDRARVLVSGLGPHTPKGEERGDCHRDEERSGQGQDDGQCHRTEHLPLDAGQRQDGHVHENDDADGECHRSKNLLTSRLDLTQPCFPAHDAFIRQSPEDVVNHHNRAIHE